MGKEPAEEAYRRFDKAIVSEDDFGNKAYRAAEQPSERERLPSQVQQESADERTLLKD